MSSWVSGILLEREERKTHHPSSLPQHSSTHRFHFAILVLVARAPDEAERGLVAATNIHRTESVDFEPD